MHRDRDKPCRVRHSNRRRVPAAQHLRGAFIVEDVDGRAARREDRRRNEREERRIFGILTASDNPHANAVFTHQRGKIIVEPLFSQAC